MKKIYLLSTCLTLLLTFLFSANLSSQDALVVGTIKNGNPLLTSLTNATAVLKGGLEAGSSVSDVYIGQDPSSEKYFLLGMIKNSGVSGKAVELQLEGGRLIARPGGPGLEVTCNGTNCAKCVPVLTKNGVHCECKDTPLQTNSACDMTTKVILSVW